MNRRDVLWGLAALATCGCARTYVPPAVGEKVQRLPPGCAPGAFDKLRADLRTWAESSPPPLYNQQFLANSRKWLHGDWQAPGAVWKSVENFRVRILRPPGKLRGVLLDFHGGGWVSGSAQSGERPNWALAEASHWAIVSVDYRLAPEHPYPTPLNDCVSAAKWLFKASPALFGTKKFAIQGRSAGAHLAALTLQRLGPDARNFSAASLYYGVFDLGGTPRVERAKDEDYPDLTPTAIRHFIEWFTPGWSNEKRRSPELSPLYGDLQRMPEALFIVGTADVLYEDTLLMARAWSEHAQASLLEYPGGPHGFDGRSVEGVTNPQRAVLELLRRLS
jgi:acetyl esterase/lipase